MNDFKVEIQNEEEIQQAQLAAFEAEEEEFEDESTWAFAGKTDECSRFGVSKAEGIAFKCDEVSLPFGTKNVAIYICHSTFLSSSR